MRLKLVIIFKVSFLLIVFVMQPVSVHAGGGVIRGTVKGGGTPIVGATVRLLELDRITYTDAKGEFVFSNLPAGEYRVFVHVIGYASATNSVHVADNTTPTSFALRESAIHAKDVIVTATPYPGTEDNQYQPVASKSTVEFIANPGSSIAEKISDLPGVAVRWNGSAPARPMLRGLSDNNVLVLENGLRIGDISTYDPAHSVPIEPMSVLHIDVVRGPSSIMYGSSAIGGLVNVITNTIPVASTNPFSGMASVSGNTVNDEYTGYFNGIYSNNGHAFGISAGGLHSQNIHIPEGMYFDGIQNFKLDHLPQTFNHAQEEGAGYSYQSDFGMIGVGYKHFEMNYGIPGTPPNDQWASLQDPAKTSRIAQNKNTVELRSLFAVDGSFIKHVRLNANYTNFSQREYPTQQDSSGISDPQANHFNKEEVNASLQFQHQRFGDFQGTIGLWTNIENLSIEGDQPLGPNSITTGIAGYIFEEYIPGDNTRFQVGLRYDYNRIRTSPYAASTDSVFRTLDVSRLSNAVTASLGVIQKFTPELTASLSLGRSFRAPTVQELFANGSDAASNTYTIGDASRFPETSIGIDASLKGSFTNVAFEFSPYINIINNYIYSYLTGDSTLSPPAALLPNRKFAGTDARLLGFEASIAVQPAQYIAVKASINYVKSEDTKNNVPLPFTPPMRGLLRVSYQDNKYSGLVELRGAGNQTLLGTGDTYTAGYGIVNIGAGIRFVQAGVVHNIGLRCDNLFNQIYRDNLSVIKDFLPQPARGFRMNYNLEF